MVAMSRTEGFRIPMAIPRLGIVGEAISAALHPPSVPLAEVEAVLSRYGLSRRGRARNFALGWRSRIVSIDTPRGRFVVKRYRDGWHEETVRHEHSILMELERLGFPAVRVMESMKGDSSVTLGDGRYAVFRFVSGRSATGRYMTHRGRVSLFHHMGVVLARLHGALDGFTPPYEHHLGYATAGRTAPRDLNWHVRTLGTLAQTSPESHPEESRLLSRIGTGSEIEARLLALDSIIASSGLDTGVIHGDFGPHNVMFESEGRAVVHDFELSRVDWRMTDLVGGASRWRPEAARAYVEGYLETRPLAAGDVAVLPAVWEHVRLTGAIQSWHTYRELGGVDRLFSASQRLDEALGLQRDGAPGWLAL